MNRPAWALHAILPEVTIHRHVAPSVASFLRDLIGTFVRALEALNRRLTEGRDV
jgi:hypothetical protein